MAEKEAFLLFQFDVDNASTMERSISLLIAALPTRSDWVLNYLIKTVHPHLRAAFFDAYIPLAPHPQDLRFFLQKIGHNPTIWNIAQATEEGREILLEMLEAAKK